MKRGYDRYVDDEGFIHAGGPPIAVNAGLCGNNEPRGESDEPVTCTVCIAMDQHVRSHRALATQPGDGGRS